MRSLARTLGITTVRLGHLAENHFIFQGSRRHHSQSVTRRRTLGVNLKSLIGKLNDSARSALEAAAGLCLSRTHYEIEVEHYLLKLLESSDNDFASITKHFGVDNSRLSAQINRSLDKLKSGNARTPVISPPVLKMLTTAWTLGSIDFNANP